MLKFGGSDDKELAMRTTSFLALTCAAAVSIGTLMSAQGPHSDTSTLFNGTSLTGWKPVGAAQWRAANGQIVGTATGTPGLLALEKSYQDVILRFSYQCTGCDAGVLLRNAASSASAPGTTSALYVALSGPDAMTPLARHARRAGQGAQSAEPLQVGRPSEPARHAVARAGWRGWLEARSRAGARGRRRAAGTGRPWRGRRSGRSACREVRRLRACGPAREQRRSPGQGSAPDGSAPPGCGRRGRGDVAELPPDSADGPVLLRGHFGWRHQPRRQHGCAVGPSRVSGTGLQARRRDLPAAGVRDRQPHVRRSLHRQLPELRARLHG